MFSKKKSLFVLSLVLSLVLVAAVGAVSAEDDVIVPSIEDGRVNGVDIAAPVAVFCEFSYPYSDDVNMGVLSSIQLWGLTNIDDGEFHEVATITADELAAAQASGVQTIVNQSHGYSLYANSDGSLTVVAPPDVEGKVYQFSWTVGDAINC